MSVESLLWDFRVAARILAKQRSFCLIVLTTLALGIGANSAIFTVVSDVLIKSLPYPHPDRLVMMAENDKDISNRMISYQNFTDWRQKNTLFDSISTIRDFDMSITEDTGRGAITAKVVASDYFRVLGLNPLMGRLFTLEDERTRSHVAVISYGFWRDHFASDKSVLGHTVSLNRIPFTVIGVTPESAGSPLSAPLWLLVGGDWGPFNWARDHRSERSAGYVIARMKSGVSVSQASQEMNAISSDLFKTYPVENAGGNQVSLVSLKESLTGNVRTALLILLASVGILLLIAGANVASLLLARAVSKRKEMAIRAALGASRYRITRQAVVEGVLLAVTGGSLGLLLAYVLLRLYSALNYRIAPEFAVFRIGGPVIVFTLLMSILTGLCLGLISAWYGSKTNLLGLVNESGRAATTGSGLRLRNAIVVGEIAMALTLLTGAGLMAKSFARLMKSPLGFNPHSVSELDINMPFGRYEKRSDRTSFYRQLIDRVSALPGVESASVSSSRPGFPDRLQNDIFPEGHPKLNQGELINVDWVPVTEDYFKTMNIPILRGRGFTREEVDGARPVVIVDESLAKQFWPGQDALGKWIKYDSPEKHEIIGIVKDVKQFGSKLQPLIKIYTPLERATILQSDLLIRTRSGSDAAVIPAVAEIVQSLDPDIPVDNFGSLDAILAQVAAPARFNTALILGFTLIATSLAISGLYGVISYLVAERTREIGIRMAIGASRRQIVVLVMSRGLKLITAGILAGLGFSFAATRLMKNLLFGISTTDMPVYVITVLVLAIVASLACLVPTLRASRIDPASALHYE